MGSCTQLLMSNFFLSNYANNSSCSQVTNSVRFIIRLIFFPKKLTVECYQSLIRLKKFTKPTRKSVVSSGFSVRRKVTRSVAQRSELVATMGCGVDLQHLVTVCRKHIYILANWLHFINVCIYHKTFYSFTLIVIIHYSCLVWRSAFGDLGRKKT